MSAGILALRRAEHDARMTGTVLKPGLGSHDLVPRPMLLHTGEINVMEGMRAQLEGGTQLADLPGRHRLGVGRQRHVEGPLQVILAEQLGDAKIQRMTAVPAGRDVGRWPHHSCLRWCTGGSFPKPCPDLPGTLNFLESNKSRKIVIYSLNFMKHT